MDSEELLLKNKMSSFPNKRIYIKRGKAIFVLHNTYFGYKALKEIIDFCNLIHDKYKKINIPIVFKLGCIQLSDKLVYVLFESICDCLIRKWGHDVSIECTYIDDIWTAGVESSPLLLLKERKKRNLDEFVHRYKRDLYRFHYRRIINGDENNDSDFLCKVGSEINSFLKAFMVQTEYRNDISEAIIELIGNAGEHTKSDCLLDLDVSPGYKKKGEDDYNYYGINIAIVNFSEKLLGAGLREKILTYENLDDRHELVHQAYELHQTHFTERYSEEDFFHIASFQHRISEREDTQYTGGTGLTVLIKSLESKSDAHKCYVISGNSGVIFKNEYLEYNSEGWIGFNKEKNFLDNTPEIENIRKNEIFFPGTAFNLNFVMKGE